jgi:hypothetical protein
MSRRGWKHREREAARLLGGTRFPANMGGRLDGESSSYVWQCKATARLSLAQIEALTVEMDRLGTQRLKHGLLLVKRAAGRGVETPWLIVVTESVWRALNGGLPTEPQAG